MFSFRLQELLDEQGIKLFPGDDRQLLMVLRAANSDPELAVEVAKKYISFSRYVLDSKPHAPNYTTKKPQKGILTSQKIRYLSLGNPRSVTPDKLFCLHTGIPDDFEEVMWDQVKTFTLLPYRDKVRHSIQLLKYT